MKKNIVEVYNEKSQRRKWTKRRMLNLAVSSGLLLTSLAVPLSVAISTGSITASAAVLDVEILSNITSSNNSGTTTGNRWTAANQGQAVDFTITGSELVGASAVFSGNRSAVLAIPTELRGDVAAAGNAAIDTNITIDMSKVTFLTNVLNAANDLTNVITQITDGAFGSLTGVNLNLTEVNQKLALLNNLENFGGASFSAAETLSGDGSYISANLDDGLGLVLAQNVTTLLQDLNAAIAALEATGTNIGSNLVATAINAALLPVKTTATGVITTAIPLVQVGGAGTNELLDASLLGSTTITLPTTVSTPAGLTQNLDAKFVGSVIRSNAIDVDLISTGNGSSYIYFAGTAAAVTAPTISNVTGTSTTGYTVTGTADPNATVEIKNQAGTVIGTGTADGSGNFTVTIPTGQATASENLNAIAKNAGGTESTATPFQTPADPTGVTAPTVSNVTGTSTTGYTVTGTADPNATIEIKNQAGTVIGTGTADGSGNFTVTIPTGQATASENLNAIAKNAGGTESTATPFQTPADPTAVTAPTVSNVTGTSTTGYTVTGTADPNATIEIKNQAGTVIGTGTADGSGNFTVTIPTGQATASENLNAVAKNAGGTESTATPFQTPADPTVVTAPTISNVTGTSLTGYVVTGTADPNATIEIKNQAGIVIGTGTANGSGDFTITLLVGTAVANEDLTATAKNAQDVESTATPFKTPADPGAVAAPIVTSVKGSSTTGYTVTGTAEFGTTIEVRDTDGNVLGTGLTAPNGEYTVTLDPGKATANENVNVVAKNLLGTESQPTAAVTPMDVAAPTVDSVKGNSTDGYTVTGTAEPGQTVEVRDTDGNVLGTGVADGSGNYTVTLDPGKAAPGETVDVVAKDADGNESQPTTAVTPMDVAAPTVDSVKGNSTDGYTVTGTAEPGQTVEVRDTDGNVLGTGVADGSGNYTVTLDPGKAAPGETVDVIAKDADGNESQPTTAVTPMDVAAPTVDSVKGNSTDGYTVTGTAEPGQTVEVHDTDGNVLGTGVADGSGNYTVTLDPGKAAPGETVDVIAKDADGNESQPTTAVTPMDVAAPTVDSVKGNSTDGYTVTGTAEPGQTVEVHDADGNVLGTGVADGSGNYTVTLDPGKAAPGETVDVIAKDADGNESQPTTAVTPMDVAAPTVTQVTGTTATGYIVTGTAEPNATVDIHNQAGTVIGTGTADGSGNFTIVIPIGEATANEDLTAVAKDADGNESPATAFKTPADPGVVAAPTVTSVKGSTTNGYTVTGTAEVGTTIEVRDTDGNLLGTGTTDTNGNYTVTLDPGKATANETVAVVAKDALGIESQPTSAITPMDVTAPTVDKVTGSSTNGYTVTGTAEPGQTVEVRDADGNVLGTGVADGSGDYTVTLDPGKATASEPIEVVAKDADGNESQPTNATTPADVTAPTVDDITGNSTDGYEVTGTADPGTTIEIKDPSGEVIGTGTADENGDYTVTIDPGKADPGDTLTVIGKDGDGNESQPTEVVVPADPIVEVTAPTISSVTGTSTTGYVVMGTADPDATVEIHNLAGTVIGTGTADGSGNFTITIPTGEATANEDLTAIAKNEAGTESTATPFKTPADPGAVAAPTVTSVKGSSTNGYTLMGTAEVGTTIEVRDTDGNLLGTGTTDTNGNYTVVLEAGKATANETVNVVAKDDAGLESQPTPAKTPMDVTAPTVDDITGNSTDGYEVTGTADPGTTIEIKDPNGNVIGTGTADENGDYTVIIEPGKANPGDTLTVIGKDGDGNESQPTEVVVPADPIVEVATPNITDVIGDSETGYAVTGTADPNVTVTFYNEADEMVGEGMTNADGEFTITIEAGKAGANEVLTAIAKDAENNMSEEAYFMTPADKGDIIIDAPTINSVTGTSTTGYVIKGKAEPNRIIEISNTRLRSMLAQGQTDAEGNFTIQLFAGQAGAKEVLIATATDGNENYSTGTLFGTPADPTTPGGDGSGNNGGNNGTGNNGAGTGNGAGPGAGNNGGNWGSGSHNMGLGNMHYGTGSGNSAKSGSYPSTGEEAHVTTGLLGGLLALLAGFGLINRKRKDQ